MAGVATFSNPVLVDEGVAFCVKLPGRKKAVAVARKALLREAGARDPLDAFRTMAAGIQEAACRLILEGVPTPVFIEPQHLHAPAPSVEPMEASAEPA